MFLNKIEDVPMAIPSTRDAVMLTRKCDSIYQQHWKYMLVGIVPREVRAPIFECAFDLDLT